MNEVRVYVPAEGKLTSIAPGSAICGQLNEHGVLLYYEGNLYGSSSMTTFENMLFHAADRMTSRYATMAMMVVRPEDVVQVGWFNVTLRQCWTDGPEEDVLLEAWKAQHWSRQENRAALDEWHRYRGIRAGSGGHDATGLYR